MENGVSKVGEEVKLKVEEFDEDGLGDGVKGMGTGDAFEETSGGVERVLAAVVLAAEGGGEDESDENGGDLGVSVELDGSLNGGQGAAEKFEDAFETPSNRVYPVEEVIYGDQPVVIEDEGKEVNLANIGEEEHAYDKVGSEANATMDYDSKPKVLDSVQAIEGESTSDNASKDQTSELEATESLVEGKGEAAKDEQNAQMVASKDEPCELKNNGVVENGINEARKESVVLEDPENGVLENLDLDETMVQEDGVNRDGELEVEANGDVSSKLHEERILGIEDKEDESRNQEEKVESVESNLQNEPKVDPTKEREQETVNQVGTSAIDETDKHVENIKPEETTPEVKRRSYLDVVKDKQSEVNSMKEKKVNGPSDKSEPKEPELRPVVGVSLSTENPPAPSSVSNSQPTPAPSRPAGLGSGAPLLESAPRVMQAQVNGNVSPPQNQVIDEPTNREAEENDETREKLQMIRVKFLRLARRLGQTPFNVVVAQVLYRLGLAEQLRGSNGGRVAAFSFERANAMAEQLEAAGQEPLEFSCTIMVLGKTGVGKSATINSIFDEVKFGTDAFQLGTKKVQDVVGTVQGIKVRVIDTPGLLPSWADQRKNEKILQSVKRFIQKSPPDIVLYLDRLDMQSRDSGDMPLLRTITDIFGPSIWFNAIVVLTHAASAPPEGPNGTTTSYDMFVTQRSHVVQQAIRQAAGDMRLMNPVSLVENHSACRTNRAGQRVLPNGQVWKPHLLLLSFASKILMEANMLLNLQDSPPGKPFAARTRAPPLPFILSNLLQSRPQLKLPQEQFGGDDDDDHDHDSLDESSDEESCEYDELPPFKRLTNSQLAKLSKAQKKSYYDELEYREKLFMKKQLKEEKKQRKMMKKMAEEAKNFSSDLNENDMEDDSSAATVPVAVQDMNLPVSFDADNPTHRYRALDSGNLWLVRPVLDPHGWDHDVGYEGINVEHLLALKNKIPVSFSGQVTKDKKDANLQMEVSGAVKHGKAKSTTVAFDMQTVGKEISYTLRSETRFINYRQNKASAGLSATYFGDSLTGGVKFEDKLLVNKRGQLVVAGGAVIGRGEVAYGGSLEAMLRDKDYPLGRFLTTLGLSVVDWHGDLALGWNAQSQIPLGRFTNLIGRVNLNNKGSGQVSVRLNSSEQLQIALVALVPLVSKLLGHYQPRDSTY